LNNDPDGHGSLAAWLRERGVKRGGIEASGGYEMDVVAALRNIRLRSHFPPPVVCLGYERR
jgi:transposase